MFKRVRWMGIGVVAGFAGSLWMQQRVKRTLEEHPSIRVGAELASMARKASRDVRDALVDGREAMAQREEELRAELAARLVPIRPDTPLLQAALPNPRHASRRPGRAGPQLRVVGEGRGDQGDEPDAGGPASIPAASRVTGPLPPAASATDPLSRRADTGGEGDGARAGKTRADRARDSGDETEGRSPGTGPAGRGREGRPGRRRR